jgi:AraC-like DNA-binding protein
MSDRFKVPQALVRRLDELGVPASAVLWQAGLSPGLFEQEKIMVSTDELFAFWRALAEVSRDPAIGLKIGCEDRIERYDPIRIAALYSRSFRDSLERIGRYKQLTCPEEIRLVEQGNECAVSLKWLLASESEPLLLLDMCFSCLVAIGQRATEGALLPARIELQRAEHNRDMYEAHFGCPVKFGASRNALVYARSDLDRPFVTHNPDLSRLLAPQLEAELQQHLAQRTVSGRVKATLKRLLAGQRPSMRQIAHELGMSSRTLQRRLAEERVSFQQILEDSRRELAQHYLVQPSLELAETAYLLGYEDSNSFFRAFQHWEGQSPGRWRAERLNERGAPKVERAGAELALPS